MFYVKTFAWRRHLMQYIKLCKLAMQVTKQLLNCFGVQSYWSPKQDTMVRTPRPGWPIIIPHALRYSISLEAFDLSPIFSLSRWILKPAFFRPSGRQRGNHKARHALFALGEGQKSITHGCRGKPLMTNQPKGVTWGETRVVTLETKTPQQKGLGVGKELVKLYEIINEAATTTRSTTSRKTKMTRTL